LRVLQKNGIGVKKWSFDYFKRVGMVQ